jgi:putative SOS response-associated peptidase YedK
MCGRYGLSTPNSQITESIEYLREHQIILEKYYKGKECFPGEKILIIKKTSTKTTSSFLTWGIKPNWSKTRIINAQKEKLFSSTFWKNMIVNDRCLVPASYFIEWQMEKGRKRPWKISLKNIPVFCMAGIFQEDKIVILTETGNSLMRTIHNHGVNAYRQPVILKPEKYEDWLNPKVNNPEEILYCLKDYLAEELVTELSDSELFS